MNYPGISPSLVSEELIAERFAIEAVAGSGGMGAVYRARDTQTGAQVALKLLHSTGVAEIERFIREAHILAELRHPGIVSYVGHGATAGGVPFLAMEWLEGEDLAQRMRRQPLSLDESLLLMQRIAEALSVAHQRGIVHRE
jgi:serine/threonine protein kinase